VAPPAKIAKAQILPDALLELARRAHIHAEAVQPDLQHHPRIVRALPARVLLLILENAQVARFRYFVHYETEMIGPQHILHMGGQQLGLIR